MGTSIPTEPIPISRPGLGASYSSSGSSFLSPSRALDGPLHTLLPALAIEDRVSESPRDPASSVLEPTKSLKTARRLSGFSAYLSSPPRSSPLSRSVAEIDESDDDGSPRRLRAAWPVQPTLPPQTSPSERWPAKPRKRRSSVSSSLFGSLPAASNPFVGSFEDSLLHSRMSAPPSAPLNFVASIGVLGSSDLPMSRRCPPHIHVPFPAVFYASPGDPRATPYVGTVDLYTHYLRMLDTPTDGEQARSSKVPRFPGYPVPERGQVQVVLKDSNETAFRPFLVPYDLTGLDQEGAGGRTFVRQKSYCIEQPDGTGRMRFAIHLNFCAPPLRKRARRGSTDSPTRFYLYQAIRVVFASRGSETSDEWRVVTDGPDAPAAAHSRTPSGTFAAYHGPPHEWVMARKKAKERAKASALARLEASTSTLGASRPPTPPPQTPSMLSSALSIASPAPPVVVPTTAFSPGAPTFAHLDHEHAVGLSFDRVPSPAPGLSERPSLSALSALRPVQQDGAAPLPLSVERERCGR